MKDFIQHALPWIIVGLDGGADHGALCEDKIRR